MGSLRPREVTVRPSFQVPDCLGRRFGSADFVPVASDHKEFLSSDRSRPQTSARRVNSEVHPLGYWCLRRKPVRLSVGAVALHPGEVSATVQYWRAGGNHEVVTGKGPAEVSMETGGPGVAPTMRVRSTMNPPRSRSSVARL